MKASNLAADALRMLATDAWSDATALLMSDDELLERMAGPSLSSLVSKLETALTLREALAAIDPATLAALQKAWEGAAKEVAGSLEIMKAAQSLPPPPAARGSSWRPPPQPDAFYDVVRWSFTLQPAKNAMTSIAISDLHMKTIGGQTTFSCRISGQTRTGGNWVYNFMQHELPPVLGAADHQGHLQHEVALNTMDGLMRVTMELRQL